MIEVVAAIIERDGKILLRQRPAQSDQAGLWSLPVVKSSRISGSKALVRELREELGIKQLWVNMLPAISEKFLWGGLSIFMLLHVPDFHGRYRHMNIRRWSGAHLKRRRNIRWPLLTFHRGVYGFYAPDQRISAKGFVITLALQQYSFGFNYRPFRIILILINAALSRVAPPPA